MPEIKLTKHECRNLMELIEYNIFDVIRNDEEIDNFGWLISIVDAYKKLLEVVEND